MPTKDFGGTDSSVKLIGMMKQTTDALFKVRQKELKKFGITPEQSGALAVIYALEGQATAAELSRILFRKPNSMTILLRRLEKQGMIKKTPDKRQKNVIRLSLTVKGRQAHMSSSRVNSLGRILNKLSDAKQRQLWTSLEKVRNQALKNLDMDVASYTRFFEKLNSLDNRAADIPGKSRSLP
jgi:DNA-binding MarR family transcriptional regulator